VPQWGRVKIAVYCEAATMGFDRLPSKILPGLVSEGGSK
jgi:hypothetical protein